MCSAQLSQGGEAKGEDRPENAGLKTRDAPIRADAARQDERSEVERPYANEMLTTPRCSGAPVSSVTTGVEQRSIS